MLEKSKNQAANLVPLSRDEVRVSLRAILRAKDSDGLWCFIRDYLHLEIPRVVIVEGENAPFDFVRDYMFGDVIDALVLANRSGGKTLIFAALDTLVAFVHSKTEVATVGAIESQAKRCYSYFKEFSQKHPFNENVAKQTMEKTDHFNGSQVQIVTGTMSGVNSPHPQKSFIDEIDLMAWQVLQQAFSMAQSKHGIQAQTVLTSTRKFANGSMQRLLNEAESKKMTKVYRWNVWAVMERLPKDNPALMAQIQEVFGGELPRDIDKADGYYSWTDLLSKREQLDDETWETEWICSRPGLEGVIYGSSFSDDNNVISKLDHLGKDGYYYIWEDFGYGEGHPDVVLFVWVPLDFTKVIVFDELYLVNYGTDDIWDAIHSKCLEHGLTMPSLDGPGSFTGWVPDYHGLTETADRRQRGAPMVEKHEESERYVVNNGIVIVRKYLASGQLMITDNCKNLRTEFLSYKKKKNLDGTYSDVPEKKNDHGPDTVRYGMIVLHDLLVERAFAMIRESQDIPEKTPEKFKKDRKTEEKELRYEKGRNITAGMWDKRF